MNVKAGVMAELKRRGFFNDCSDFEALNEIMNTRSVTFYIGFDCTAKSMHVGNLMQIMLIRLLQSYGHKPIVIFGGGTTRVGDPSGKDEARKMLSDEEIADNIAGLVRSLSKFINFNDTTSSNCAIALDNAEWLDNLRYIDFLREYGSVVSVNRMLTMDSVRLRLEREQNLSFLEFNYMLLQGYDFVHLAKHYNCELQLGGRDQWGNIISGIDLVRRKLDKQVFALTTPLLTTSAGAKMGKTATGAVWLNEDMLSPYEYYQYWRNIDDADILRFAGLYAEYDSVRCDELSDMMAYDVNGAKRHLAYTLTELCHGVDAAIEADAASVRIFTEGGVSDNMPTFRYDGKAFNDGVYVSELLLSAGLCESKSDARKMIRSGGVRINNITVDNEILALNTSDTETLAKYVIDFEQGIKLSAGKKRHVLIVIE